MKYEADLAARDGLDAASAKAAAKGAPDSASRTVDLETSLQTLDDEIAGLTQQLKTRSPHYWDFRSPQPLSVADLQGAAGQPALLGPDEALVLWMIPPGRAKGLVFAVTREAFAWARAGLTGHQPQDRVDHLRRQINPDGYTRALQSGLPLLLVPLDPNWGGFDREAAREIHQALLGDPNIQAVIGPKHALLIAPSGPMWSLPPGLLVTAKPAEGWVKNGDPATLRSTHWLLRDKATLLSACITASPTRRRRRVFQACRGRSSSPVRRRC